MNFLRMNDCMVIKYINSHLECLKYINKNYVKMLKNRHIEFL